MIDLDTKIEIAEALNNFAEAMRGVIGPGASHERQIEVMREALSLSLASHVFSAELMLQLGVQTEMKRLTDRAFEMYEKTREGAAATMRGMR